MVVEILFEDNYIIVVNKPNNVLIHNSYYARNIKEPTLLALLSKQLGADFYPLHRLDRKTSGVLVLAKHKKDVTIFQDLFTVGKIEKIYIAIVRGFIEYSNLITSPVKNPDTHCYKEAETFVEPLRTKQINIPVHPYENARYSLVKLLPTTGRMHQLRIHMNKISHPIVGDYKYGDRFHNRMFENEFDCCNLFLHAYQLNFTHPITEKNIAVKANLPDDWHKVFKTFKWSFL